MNRGAGLVPGTQVGGGGGGGGGGAQQRVGAEPRRVGAKAEQKRPESKEQPITEPETQVYDEMFWKSSNL